MQPINAESGAEKYLKPHLKVNQRVRGVVRSGDPTALRRDSWSHSGTWIYYIREPAFGKIPRRCVEVVGRILVLGSTICANLHLARYQGRYDFDKS